MNPIIKGLFFTSGMWVLSLSLAGMVVLLLQQSYASTIEIPTYEPDDYVGYGFEVNGSRVFDYNNNNVTSENMTSVPYKNGSIVVDLNAYIPCAKDIRPQVIAEANLEGTNLPSHQYSMEQEIASQLDMCISLYGSASIESVTTSESLKVLGELANLTNMTASVFNQN